MIDIQFIRDNPIDVKENNKIRNADVDVDKILKLDENRRELVTQIDEKRAELKGGSKSKPSADEIKKLKKLGEEIKKLEEKLFRAS